MRPRGCERGAQNEPPILVSLVVRVDWSRCAGSRIRSFLRFRLSESRPSSNEAITFGA